MSHMKGISDEKSSVRGLFLRTHKIADESQCYWPESAGPFYNCTSQMRCFLSNPNLFCLLPILFGLGRKDHNQISKTVKGRHKEEGFPFS